MTKRKNNRKTNPDPATLAQIAEQASDRILGQNPVVGVRKEEFLEVGKILGQQAIKQPKLLINHQLKFLNNLASSMRGKSDFKPAKGDKRFNDEAWQTNPLLRRVQQSYLAATRELHEWLDETGLEGTTKDRARYLIDLSTDALAPSNTLLNPAAVKAALETKGQSLVRGAKNLASDIIHEGGMPSQVDKTAFEVGGNLATTPGKVVFRNETFELIQYSPTTEQVYERPLLIIPPQINKFYVFDLSPEKSLVKYLLSQGQQVFIVSWRNPQKQHSDWDMEHYVEAGIQAIDTVCGIAGTKDCNIQGSCSGGMMLVVLAAFLAAKRRKKIHSLTLFVCVFETSSESLLGLFASDSSIEAARAASQRKGVLEGKEMARIFAWLRPNDLIWNYWVNNYLLGRKAPAFDILYWNADTTRLAAAYHSDILDVFKDNVLAKAGEVKINNTPIDLSKIKCDMFALAGTTDHITPWQGCYRSIKLVGGKVDFVLSNSGHIQSILNPPTNPKASYLFNADLPDNPEDWLKTADHHPGSWWERWSEWLEERGGDLVDAPSKPGNKKHAPLADAPGTYVF